jgi:hypothetical protein
MDMERIDFSSLGSRTQTDQQKGPKPMHWGGRSCPVVWVVRLLMTLANFQASVKVYAGKW